MGGEVKGGERGVMSVIAIILALLLGIVVGYVIGICMVAYSVIRKVDHDDD